MNTVTRRMTFAGVAILLALASGCVTGRRAIDLPLPAAAATPAAASAGARGTFQLGQVTDARAFENKPRAPSTPSIDGDVATLTAEQKQTFIGRQRNGYGAAMGDIVLAPSQSVPERVRALLASGLAARGYTVTDSTGTGPSANVKVTEFWAWFSPGAFSVSFEARIRATLEVLRDGNSNSIEVEGYGLNRGQMASDDNWQLAYSRAFESFLTNLDKELGEAGL